MVYEKILSRRTIRKFTEKTVEKDILIKCVDGARLSPSGMNRQPLKFLIVQDQSILPKVFETTSWAAYLPEYKPTEREMPRAYIIILLDKAIRDDCGHDAGIAAMSISMIAYDEGLGSCILGAIDRPKLRTILNIPRSLDIILAVALGYPAENPVVDKVRDGNIKYWLDEDDVLHVPKRDLQDILVWNKCPEPCQDSQPES